MVTRMGMPPVPNREDINATWKYLEDGITRIMTDLEQGMDMQMYMGVYTAVITSALHKKPLASVARA